MVDDASLPGPAPATARADAVSLVLALVAAVRPLFRPGEHRSGGPAPRHLIALLQLSAAGTTSVGGLAERLAVTLPTASLLVSELAELGLVTRQEDPGDHRRTLVQVVPGEEVTGLLDRRLGPLERAFAGLAPETRRALLGGLRELGRQLAGAPADPADTL